MGVTALTPCHLVPTALIIQLMTQLISLCARLYSRFAVMNFSFVVIYHIHLKTIQGFYTSKLILGGVQFKLDHYLIRYQRPRGQ